MCPSRPSSPYPSLINNMKQSYNKTQAVCSNTMKAHSVHECFENLRQLLSLNICFLQTWMSCSLPELAFWCQTHFSWHTWLCTIPSLTCTVMISDRLYKWQQQQIWQRWVFTAKTVCCANQRTVHPLHACLTHPSVIHRPSSLESGPESDWTTA